MDYYIYLKNTNEYIKETDDDKIWTRTNDINYAFNDSDYERVNNIAQFICNDKHLRYEDLSIIGEEVVIQTTEYPVGNLKPLYYYKGILSDSLSTLHKMVEIRYFLNELTELAFDELYYTIDNVQELMDWCEVEGYSLDELDKAFGISIWE